MNKQSFIAGQASGQHAAKKYYLGLDLGGTNIVAGVVDEDYNILSKKSIPANAGRPVEEVTRDMAEVGKEAVRQAGLQLSDVSSCGTGVPSCINPATNLLVHANNFGWKNVPVYDCLQKHISLPLYISNDANCAAYGEVLAGAAKNCTDAIMLTLGTGVGGGIVMNRKIYSGADTMGAELGHTKLVYNGIRCTCGQYGCLESYCSSTALIRRTKEAVKAHPGSMIMEMAGHDTDRIDGKTVFDSAKKGDPLAAEIVDEYTGYLAAGISTFIVIFRPQVIILGGGIAHAGEILLEPLNKKLFTCTFGAEEIGIPKVIRAALGNDAGLIGAAFLEKSI
ncbi:MAG: ROK family glucokinase [Tannerella sp.]|jgi:glucokinase|nr:ROK family glucokinase [Tannerella sp.]